MKREKKQKAVGVEANAPQIAASSVENISRYLGGTGTCSRTQPTAGTKSIGSSATSESIGAIPWPGGGGVAGGAAALRTKASHSDGSGCATNQFCTPSSASHGSSITCSISST